jgi:hypothetical protein
MQSAKGIIERSAIEGRLNLQHRHLDRLKAGGTERLAELAGLVRCARHQNATG